MWSPCGFRFEPSSDSKLKDGSRYHLACCEFIQILYFPQHTNDSIWLEKVMTIWNLKLRMYWQCKETHKQFKSFYFLKKKTFFFYQIDTTICHFMIVMTLIEIKQEVPDFIIFINFVIFHNSSTCRCITFAPPPSL